MRVRAKGLAFLLALLLCAGFACPRAMASEEPDTDPTVAEASAETETVPAEAANVPAVSAYSDSEARLPEESSGAVSPEEKGPAEEPPAETAGGPEEPLQLDGAAVSNVFPFTDVGAGAWYYESVSYAYFNRLMNGVGGSVFRPDGTTTRAMVVTVLWRMAGAPAPSGECAFTDLSQDWYRTAVAWAWEKGVAKGVADTVFRPDDPVTREQMAAFIARFAQVADGLDTESGGDLSAFPDESTVSAYARPAMAWANTAGLIQGSAEGGAVVLAPKGSATRAQVAAILMRYRLKFNGAGAGAGIAEFVADSRTAGKTNQIVTVVNHDIAFWERGNDGVWRKLLSAYAGYGVNGLSADRREGDKTTPIGAFPLLYAFGRDNNPGTDMTYRRITSNSYFSSDTRDGTYNTWVESSRAVTGEHLADYADLQYRWGIVIGFNTDPVVVGRGSAIFLHCKGNSWSTAGCVSVERSVMTDILDRVNDGAWIIIVKSTQDLKNY